MAISDKQKKILAFPFTSFDALICDGAVRSGKTAFMTLGFIEDGMRRFNGQRFGICGKTVDSTIKNIIVPFLSITLMQERYKLAWHRSDKILEVSRGTVTNLFEVFGGRDESSFMLIQGRTLAGVLLDEVALQPRSFVEQALARCSVDGSKLWFNCNPEAPTHWFYKEWVLKAEAKNALRLHFLLRDNPSLSDAIIRRYESMYTGVFYDRYILGRWVAAEGAIYRQFCDNPDRYITDRPPQIMRAVIGVDFGGGTSAHAFCCLGFTAGMRDLVVLDELREQDALTPDVLEQRFVDFVRRCQMRWLVTDAYCDNAEKTLIAGLRTAAAQARLPLNIGNAIKRPINDRIRALCILMGADRFRVVRSCTATIDALRSAVWDAKKPVADVRLDDGTTNIDSLDALEYAYERDIETLVSMWRQT